MINFISKIINKKVSETKGLIFESPPFYFKSPPFFIHLLSETKYEPVGAFGANPAKSGGGINLARGITPKGLC